MAFFSDLIKAFKDRRQAAENLAAFKTQLLTAVADGRLTSDEVDRLNDLRFRLHISEQDISSFAGPAYAAAFQAVTVDGFLTEAEEKELQEIQFFLLVPDSQIVRNREELQRLRLLREIEEGKLPTTNAHGLVLQADEVAYCREQAFIMEERVTDREYVGGSHGISLRIAKGLSYRVGSYKGHLVSRKGIVQVSRGDIVVTNQRIIFRGDRKGFNIKVDKLLGVDVLADGLRITDGNGRPHAIQLYDFKRIDIVAAILSHAINAVSV